MPILGHSYFGTMHDLYSIQVIYFVQHLSEIQLIRFSSQFSQENSFVAPSFFLVGQKNYLLHCIGVNYWSLICYFHCSHAKVHQWAFKLLLLKYCAPFTFSFPSSSVIHSLNKKTLLLVLLFYHLK